MRWFVVFTFLFGVAYSDRIEVVKDGPIHEAFVSAEAGALILQTVPLQPPKAISEHMPPRMGSEFHWIPGYWAWSYKLSTFLWVSGVWRVPPPGMIWIEGKWVEQSKGAIWYHGFWSPTAEADLSIVDQAPPDQIDESVPQKPAGDYFWVPGYWEFDHIEHDYIWYKGRWHPISENWQYMPAHYVWRQNGYMYIPGYWDVPIEHRGVVYASAKIAPQDRESVRYEPSVVLEPLYILEQLYPDWPNYANLFYHHYFYNKDVWIAWGAVPPWWNWDLWWTFAVQDQWWLFWWWSHPGYPHPFFINKETAHEITPPKQFVVEMMKSTHAPYFIANDGVVGEKTLIRAIKKVMGSDDPILPPDRKIMEQVKEVSYPKQPPLLRYEPSGKKVIREKVKPFFGPTHDWLNKPPRNAKVADYPTVEPTKMEHPSEMEKKSRPPTYREPQKRFPQLPEKTTKIQSSYSRAEQQATGVRSIQVVSSQKDNYYPQRNDFKMPSKPELDSPPSISTFDVSSSDVKKPYKQSAKPPQQGSVREVQKYKPLH